MELSGADVKLWRYDSSQTRLPLGRGDEVTSPSRSAKLIARHTFLDKHRLAIERPQNQPSFFSGVKIIMQEMPKVGTVSGGR